MDPQQRVEADEMVHVHVRHEHVTDPQEVAVAQRGKVAQIEQHGAALMRHFDEQGWVTETPVD
jgi:hypothetical protein